MAGAAAAFRQVLAKVRLRAPRIPFIANATADVMTDPEDIREALARQLISPVRWRESLQRMLEMGVNRFVEVGPGDVLTGLVRRMGAPVQALTVIQAIG